MLLSVQCAVAFSELKAELLQFNPSQTRTPELTQTEAHLSLPMIMGEINRWYGFNTMPIFQDLIKKITTKEKQYLSCCYSFYTGTANTWISLGDVYKKLYELFNQGKPPLTDIRVFKWLSAPKKTLLELLKAGFTNGNMVDDTMPLLKSYVISANLAPFGNVNFPGECTFEYFLNAKSHTPISDTFYTATLAIFGLSENEVKLFIPELQKLPDYLNIKLQKPAGSNNATEDWNPQTLTQIFIPKALADKIAYITWIQGIPFEESLISWVENNARTSFGKILSYKDLKTPLENIRTELITKKGTHPLHKAMLSGIMQNKYIPSKYLEQYRYVPYLVPNLNFMQARINLYFDDIEKLRTSGIKMFDYRLTTPEQEKNYQEALNTVCQKIYDFKKAKDAQEKLTPVTAPAA